jgi:hypothetical protein
MKNTINNAKQELKILLPKVVLLVNKEKEFTNDDITKNIMKIYSLVHQITAGTRIEHSAFDKNTHILQQIYDDTIDNMYLFSDSHIRTLNNIFAYPMKTGIVIKYSQEYLNMVINYRMSICQKILNFLYFEELVYDIKLHIAKKLIDVSF